MQIEGQRFLSSSSKARRSTTASARIQSHSTKPSQAPVRDVRIAEQIKTLAGQGATQENAATVLSLSVDDLTRLYAADWAQGLAIGEIKVQQTLFNQGVGRRAEIDHTTGLVTRAEVKPNPNAAIQLHKQFQRQRARQRVLDLSKVHPDQLAPGMSPAPAPERRGRGRPKFSGKFTRKLGEYICDHIAAGRTLTDICTEIGNITPHGVRKWARDDEAYPEFCSAFARARRDQIDAWADEAITIADNVELDEVITTRVGPDGETVERRREKAIAHAKLRIDTRLKLIARLQGNRRWEEGERNNWDDDADDRGPIEVIIRGGTPK